jgi:hypothetical protein
MSNRLLNQRIVAITTGGTSTAYGTAYGDKAICGQVVRIDWSGAGLGGSGFFRLQESGTLTGAYAGGSALDAAQMDWCDSVYPLFKAKNGADMSVELMEGSAFVPYHSTRVPYLIVSGCNAGSLTMDLFWIDKR